jgi:hypothetical protein
MRKVWRGVLIGTAAAVIVFLVIILLIRFTPHPPVGEMEKARQVLALAEKNNADIYSKKLFSEAKILYDSAMVNWKKENKRFIFFRNYDKVILFARLSSKKANLAADNSTTSSSTLKIKLKQKIESLNDLVAQIDELFTTYPLTSEVRNRISKGKILLEEAEIIYNKGQYLKANRKITDSEYLLTESYENASANLKNYFKSYSQWKKWVNKTLSESRKNNDYSIIIDKFSRKCMIYLNGSRQYSFEAELGKNWVGDKRVKGDMATPEGMYKIAKKIDGSKTKYYKALLLDYPNDEDKEKFRYEIEHGTLPASAKIGGLIEIHGNGGKGIDWTEGCIAIADKEMDIIFKIVRVGTPVTIIGSMVELREVVDN